HKVKVISPQYVKPFVRGQKNDGNGAQAIAVDLMQPTMQFVPPKSPEQQDIQALHRARQRIGKGTEFKNGRHFAAWLGLVPRQHSSGDRQVLMNMTKKGDTHLRTLFIHGARAVVRVATNNNDGRLHQWVNQLKERHGFNKTTVAVANKNARIIWSMLRNDTEYQAAGS
ncbi:transposase, partial [Salmonella enterica subsp. enterica]|nr:transposase [Salmonella enterica subsp. enterica serovar Everleigh]